MRRIFSSIIVCTVLTNFWNCNSEQGIELPILSSSRIIASHYDTLSIDASVILIDSINTTNPSQLLIGYMEEVDIGNTVASTYTNLLPATVPDGEFINSSTVFDSVELILEWNNYFLGDTNLTQFFSVYELADSIRSTEDQENTYIYYHFDKINVLDKLADFSVKPAQIEKNLIRLKLSDDFGRKIFSQRTNEDLFRNSVEFSKVIRGIKISPTGKSINLILGINYGLASLLRLHYHTSSDTASYNIFFGKSFKVSKLISQKVFLIKIGKKEKKFL